MPTADNKTWHRKYGTEKIGTQAHIIEVNMLKIGELAALFNISNDTLRFYEKNNILKPSQRSANGYRLYSNDDKEKLAFVLQAKSVGFSLIEISELLFIDVNKNNKTCNDAKAIVNRKLQQVQAKLAELARLEEALKSLADSCNGGTMSATHCTILQALSSTTSPLSLIVFKCPFT